MNTLSNISKRYPNDEAAVQIGIKPSTLNLWRTQRKGPDYIRVGRRVYYTQEQIDAFLAANTVRLQDERA